MTQEIYKGICKGGPNDGKSLVHEKTKFAMVKPVIDFPALSQTNWDEHAEVSIAPLGSYVWAHNIWFWEPAK